MARIPPWETLWAPIKPLPPACLTDARTHVYFVDYLRKIFKVINNLFLPPTRHLCCGPSYHSDSVQGRQTNMDFNPRGWGQLAWQVVFISSWSRCYGCWTKAPQAAQLPAPVSLPGVVLWWQNLHSPCMWQINMQGEGSPPPSQWLKHLGDYYSAILHLEMPLRLHLHQCSELCTEMKLRLPTVAI